MKRNILLILMSFAFVSSYFFVLETYAQRVEEEEEDANKLVILDRDGKCYQLCRQVKLNTSPYTYAEGKAKNGDCPATTSGTDVGIEYNDIWNPLSFTYTLENVMYFKDGQKYQTAKLDKTVNSCGENDIYCVNCCCGARVPKSTSPPPTEEAKPSPTQTGGGGTTTLTNDEKCRELCVTNGNSQIKGGYEKKTSCESGEFEFAFNYSVSGGTVVQSSPGTAITCCCKS